MRAPTPALSVVQAFCFSVLLFDALLPGAVFCDRRFGLLSKHKLRNAQVEISVRRYIFV